MTRGQLQQVPHSSGVVEEVRRAGGGMKDALVVDCHGIKCDALGCDYIDPAAVDPAKFLNVPCPKCGANLLTPEDFDAIRMVKALAALISAELPMAEDDTEHITVAVSNMDGSGDLNFTEVAA